MDKILSDFRVWLSRYLPAKIMRTIRPFLTVQFMVFMLMGTVNTVISISTATLLDVIHKTYLPPDNAVRIIAAQTRSNFIFGYAVSIVTSFFLNSKYTFHQKPTFKRFIRFPISYIPNFIIQYIFVLIFTSFGKNQTTGYIFAAIIGTPVTFAAMKLFVFRIKQKNSKED